MKCLDMIIDEGNWDQHQFLLASLTQHLDGVLSTRFQPWKRAHFALPNKSVRVGPSQFLHDQLHCDPHLGGVRIASVHHVLRDRVGGEEKDNFTANILWKCFQLLPDVLSECL